MSKKDVVEELIVSERNYVSDLEKIVEKVVVPVQEGGLLPKGVASEIFSNIVQVLEVNREFLADVEKEKERALKEGTYADVNVGQVIQKHVQMFKLYATHCSNMSILHSVLEASYQKYPEFSAHVQTVMRDPIFRKLPLESFLMSPMQRITKYPLLLKELLKILHKSQDGGDDSVKDEIIDIEKALDNIKKNIDLLNERTRRVKNVQILQGIQSRLVFPSDGGEQMRGRSDIHDIVQIDRSFVFEGVLQYSNPNNIDSLFGKRKVVSSSVYCLLFSDILLFGVVEENTSNDDGKSKSRRKVQLPKHVLIYSIFMSDDVELDQSDSIILYCRDHGKVKKHEFTANEVWKKHFSVVCKGEDLITSFNNLNKSSRLVRMLSKSSVRKSMKQSQSSQSLEPLNDKNDRNDKNDSLNTSSNLKSSHNYDEKKNEQSIDEKNEQSVEHESIVEKNEPIDEKKESIDEKSINDEERVHHFLLCIKRASMENMILLDSCVDDLVASIYKNPQSLEEKKNVASVLHSLVLLSSSWEK